MTSYAGLDVSQQETHVCVLSSEGEILHEGKCATEPGSIAQALKKHASQLKRAVLETGGMSAWLAGELEKAGVPVVCCCARQAHAALKHGPNKTDRDDAFGLARLAQTGWLKPVNVRSLAAHEQKNLLLVRERLVQMRVDTVNLMRGILKQYGIRIGRIKASDFDRHVLDLAAERPLVQAALDPLLGLRARLLDEVDRLDRQLMAMAREDGVCTRLMSAPGVGYLTALTFKAVIDNPGRFRKSADLGAYLGLVPRRWQSGELDQSGRITRCGDAMLRHLLYECANIVIAILKKDCALKRWATQLQARVGARKARTALARKLAVLLHKLWTTGESFDWQRGMPA